MPRDRLYIFESVSFSAIETGRHFHVNGITVNKTIQTVESAAASGAFYIEDVYPLIDGGRFPVKRIVGERVEVWADIYRDGDDIVAAGLIWRREQDPQWRHAPMNHHSDDRWSGSFVPDQPGRYLYAIEAWTDAFTTWRRGFELKQQTGADIPLDAIEGAGLLTKAQGGGKTAAAIILRQCEAFLQTGNTAALLTAELKESTNQTNSVIVTIAMSPEVHEFWLPIGGVEVGISGDRRHIAALEDLITGERYPLEWGGVRLRIDPAHDPALLFRCLA